MSLKQKFYLPKFIIISPYCCHIVINSCFRAHQAYLIKKCKICATKGLLVYFAEYVHLTVSFRNSENYLYTYQPEFCIVCEWICGRLAINSDVTVVIKSTIAREQSQATSTDQQHGATCQTR